MRRALYFLDSPHFFRPNFFLSLYAKKISTPQSPDKKVNSVTYTNPRKTPNTMSNCWEFEPQDPIGKYVLTVKIGKHELEKQVFYVGK